MAASSLASARVTSAVVFAIITIGDVPRISGQDDKVRPTTTVGIVSAPVISDSKEEISVGRVWSPALRGISANQGFRLLAIELTPIGKQKVILKQPDLVVTDAQKNEYVAIGGSALLFEDNFAPFDGFVSGWRVLFTCVPGSNCDRRESEVRIGRDAAADPISFVLSGAKPNLYLVYIVPISTESFHLRLPNSVIPVAPNE